MKPEIHPDYHKVIFVDSATGSEWVSRSTATSKEMRALDGEEVPVIRLEISSISHPFWTGKMRELDTDGKIDRFRSATASRRNSAGARRPRQRADSTVQTRRGARAPRFVSVLFFSRVSSRDFQ